MKTRLLHFIETEPSNLLTTRILKKDPELYSWILSQTEMLSDVRFVERIWFIVNGERTAICSRGKKKTMNPKTHQYGFCGNKGSCACFQEHVKNNPNQLSPTAIQSILTKRVQTWKERYGVDNPAKASECQQKRNQTIEHLKVEGVYGNWDNQLGPAYDRLCERLRGIVSPKFSREDYVGSFRKNFYSWVCDVCGSDVVDHVDYGRIPKCQVCFPKSQSKGEKEIAEFLKENNLEIIERDKTIISPLELDIVCRSKKIAIEYNGSYWHSSEKKSSDYHLNKTTACREAGFRLIHIFEDEWKRSPEIIKQRLLSAFGKNERVFARKCSVNFVSSKQAREFVSNHHLQGSTGGSHFVGAFCEAELVAVMVFGKSRFTDHQFELIRYCSVGTIVGGPSKMLAFFKNKVDPRSIVSYSMNTWGDGGMYEQIGFSRIDQPVQVGYWYIKGNERWHRSSFTKKKLVAEGFDSSKTESQIMAERGFLKIYDCGSTKFVWEK